MVFHSNISEMFNQTIDSTSFDYGMLLCVTEQRLHRFYRKVLLNDGGIMVSLINLVSIICLHCITILIYSN